MIELAIMIAILGILVVVATPSSDVGRAQLDAFAQRLRSDLHYAQEMAMTTNTVHGFRVINATTYEIFVGAPGAPAIDPYKRGQFVINLADDYSLLSFVNPGGQPTIQFNASGSPTIAAGPNIVFTDGTLQKQIVVTPNTGVAVIQ